MAFSLRCLISLFVPGHKENEGSVAPFVPLVIVFLPQVVLATLQAKHNETSEASNNTNDCEVARNELFHVTIACLGWWAYIHIERIEEHGCRANAAALIVFLKVFNELQAHLSILPSKYFVQFIDLLERIEVSLAT